MRRAWRAVTWAGTRLVASVIIAAGLLLVGVFLFTLLVASIADTFEDHR